MNYLTKIIDYKKEELSATRRKRSLADVRARAADAEPTRDFFKAVTVGAGSKPAPINIIAEIKKASPSKGVIVKDFDPARIASLYEEGGARALSVLTDRHFFQGELGHIRVVKGVATLPVLRKDFTIDEYNIYEARGAGADAVLLIATILEKGQLDEYVHMSAELGMTAFVEVHDEEDIEKIGSVWCNGWREGSLASLPDRQAGGGQAPSPQPPSPRGRGLGGGGIKRQDPLRHYGPLVGINNRDLVTFKTDVGTTERLKPLVPSDIPVVSESGISERGDIERLKKCGVNIFLIGEVLLKADDIGGKLAELLEVS